MSTFTKFDIDYEDFSNFRSKRIKYKYKKIIYSGVNMQDVYEFFKEDIIFFTNFYKKEVLNIDLNILYEDEDETIITKNIYHLQVDSYGKKICEEKNFLENRNYIVENFDVYIIIERYPLNFPQKEINDILQPTFKLYGGEERILDYMPNKTIKYKTKTIETGNDEPQKIFSQTLPHLINFQCLYKTIR